MFLIDLYRKSGNMRFLKKGTNLLNIKCFLGGLSDEIQITDYWYYGTSTYSSNTNLNIDLPSNFKIEYEEYITQVSSNSCYISIGERNDKALLCGKVISTDSTHKVYARNGTDIISIGSTIPLTGWNNIIVTYNGNKFNFNNDIELTNLNGISLNKLISFSTWKSSTTSGQIRNIKISKL